MIFNQSIIISLFSINKFLIYNLFLINIFNATEIKCCFFFCERMQYWDREDNTANIVPFLSNQIADVLYVSDNTNYSHIYDSTDNSNNDDGK